MKKLLLTLPIFTLLSCGKSDSKKENNTARPRIAITALSPVVYQGDKIVIATTGSGSLFSGVEFYVDDTYLGYDAEPPFSITSTLRDLTTGTRNVRVVGRAKEGAYSEASSSFIFKVKRGVKYQGGIVFQVNIEGTHGLIATETDLVNASTATFSWGHQTDSSLGTTQSDGNSNTELMMQNSNSFYHAANYRKDTNFDIYGFRDWYIPAMTELDSLKENSMLVGGFVTSDVAYFSSTEISDTSFYALNFYSPSATTYSKKSAQCRVRLIRQF